MSVLELCDREIAAVPIEASVAEAVHKMLDYHVGAVAVVDSEFRVHGIRNLRIVDASIFPRIPGYFIVTAVYMIAEKAADVILRDAGHTTMPSDAYSYD